MKLEVRALWEEDSVRNIQI